MTWEQELKIQSKEIAAKIAPIMAKNMAEGMAKDLAKDMAQNMVKEARAEESKKKAIETAKNFLLKGFEPTVIAECTSLPLEQVLSLQKELRFTNK